MAPAGPWRGGKYSGYEGGTRVPFIARWPGRIKPGVSDALVCQVDFTASFAALTGQKFSTTSAPDSVNVLPALLGDSKMGRTQLVEHDGFERLGFRDGQKKYLEPLQRPNRSLKEEFFQLNADPSETNDLSSSQPEEMKRLGTLLKQAR